MTQYPEEIRIRNIIRILRRTANEKKADALFYDAIADELEGKRSSDKSVIEETLKRR